MPCMFLQGNEKQFRFLSYLLFLSKLSKSLNDLEQQLWVLASRFCDSAYFYRSNCSKENFKPHTNSQHCGMIHEIRKSTNGPETCVT